jgi:hypothetical protein
MATDDLVALTTRQWVAMASDDLVSLTTGQWVAMATDDLRGLNTTQWAAVATDDLVALTSGQWAAMASDDLRGLSTTQWAAVATDDLVALTSGQWAAMASDDLRGLSTTQWAAVATDDLVALTSSQWAAMATDDLRVVVADLVGARDWDLMETADFRGLTTTQWTSMTTIDLKQLATDSEFSNQWARMATDDLAAIMTLTSGSISPIVLDLEGDGLQLLPVGAGVRFDIGAEGRTRPTGWIAPSDGLLVRDINGDGRITSGAELFGEATRLLDGTTAKDGFEALGDVDGNQDGRLDESDWIWGQLLIWRDFDTDGVTDSGELQTLEQSGVTSISVLAEKVSWWQAGNEVRLESCFVNQAGQTGMVADVWFAVLQSGSVPGDCWDRPI